jgi:O-methyltransferase
MAKGTLPAAPIKQLSLLRLDRDMYESTIQTLDSMHWKLSSNGFVIIDDYILAACKSAVDDFRVQHGIAEKLEMVDGAAVDWRKGPNELAASPTPVDCSCGD